MFSVAEINTCSEQVLVWRLSRFYKLRQEIRVCHLRKNKTTVLRICTLLLWPINPSGSRGRVFNPYQWDPSDIKRDHYHHSALCSLQVENIKAMNSEHLEYSLKALILQSENVTHGHRWCLSNILPNTPLGLASCLPWLRPLIKSLWPLHLLICFAAWLPCAGDSQTSCHHRPVEV